MGIFKKANNIYITVRDTYTSISGSSYEEAEEVIIEATNGDLELVSQKKVIMQGLGNNSDTQETEEQSTEEEKVINAPCVVHFRPHNDWQGEFGFDWFRTGDTGMRGDNDFRKTIGYYYKNKGTKEKYKSGEIPKSQDFEIDSELLVNAQKEFVQYKINEKIANDEVYFVPKMTLPKGKKAILKLLINRISAIKNDEFLSFKLKKHKECFKLSDEKITIGEFIKKQCVFEIECIEEFTDTAPVFLEIEIMEKFCGALQIYPNGKKFQKKIDITLVKVSNREDEFKIEPQKDFLKKILGQALVTPLFDREPFFLTKRDRDYLLKEKKPENIIQRINDITKDHKSKIMFLIDVDIENMTGITPIGRKYSICFGKNISGTTMAHEFLHSLNLLEVFDGDVKKKKIGNNIMEIKSPVVYKIYSTNNIMDYSKENEKNKQSERERISLFSWQWKIINNTLEAIKS